MKNVALVVSGALLSSLLLVAAFSARTTPNHPAATKAAFAVFHGPRVPAKEGVSPAWAGYVIKPGLNDRSATVTGVVGQWVVPSLICDKDMTFSAAWVGIDGYSGNTVEQIGTGHYCSGGKASYNTWFEMYPNAARYISEVPVAGGNIMRAEVRSVGHDRFSLTVTNLTLSRSFTTAQTMRARRESAEWVVEAPSSSWGRLPLANFRTIEFSDARATLDGQTGPVDGRSGTNYAVTMFGSNPDGSKFNRAIPSALSEVNNNSSFSVTWLHQ